ncbi:MAG: sigma-70 family RNA polymerase sigma factor [Gammaproteobacteria bacterium]|nr:sigma-70 family RNA polymerase sigma factor [Gammaproteobacteria bacterium]
MTDEELMRAVRSGEHYAYQELVKKYLASISCYAYRMIGNQNDTNDITQETFLKLWVNAEKWDPKKAKLTTWLHRIAHNLCIDHLRKHKRNQPLKHTDEEQGYQETWCEKDGNKNELNEKLQELATALRGLPEIQRSALTLCHYSGFSNKEAASIMNISVKALESAISRAKRSLRKALSNCTKISSNEAGI